MHFKFQVNMVQAVNIEQRQIMERLVTMEEWVFMKDLLDMEKVKTMEEAEVPEQAIDMEEPRNEIGLGRPDLLKSTRDSFLSHIEQNVESCSSTSPRNSSIFFFAITSSSTLNPTGANINYTSFPLNLRCYLYSTSGCFQFNKHTLNCQLLFTSTYKHTDSHGVAT
ncbi:hypothetical protein ACLB2K_045695 [Fragaria x ananassa]